MSEYTEGICENTVLILKDGIALHISEILQELNKADVVQSKNERLKDAMGLIATTPCTCTSQYMLSARCPKHIAKEALVETK